MNFSTSIAGLNALQGGASVASYSKHSLICDNSNNCIGFQTLTFATDVSILLPPSTDVSVVFTDKIPSNCMIYSTVAYSSGLTGTNASGVPIVSGDNTSTDLTMSIQAQNSSLKTEILNDFLQYPNMVSGEYNPKNPTNPFVLALLASNADPYENLKMVFRWTGSETLSILYGRIYVKMVLMQADPNNTARDHYPTGGVEQGPVPGNLPLPSV